MVFPFAEKSLQWGSIYNAFMVNGGTVFVKALSQGIVDHASQGFAVPVIPRCSQPEAYS
jgi:hypothetical protein